MSTVVFACVHNAGRSQMAAAWFNRIADSGKARAVSAGTQPAEAVHPVVVEAMREVGIDLSHARPRLLTHDVAQGAALLITMGCGDDCPYVPGLATEDWPQPDPRTLDLAEVRVIRDDIRRRVIDLLEREGWSRG